MAIGIKAIGTYIPREHIDLTSLLTDFNIDLDFLDKKTGTRSISRKEDCDETSDLCVKAFTDLVRQTGIQVDQIDCLVVVTQNPDGMGLPHTSAIVHAKLGMRSDVAVFDVSLGCTGFVHGLSILGSFMVANGMKRGVLFTADPYSKIIDPKDKNTALLFGDAACATLLEESDVGYPVAHNFTFATNGKENGALTAANDFLSMNGRAVFNYSAQAVPPLVQLCLDGSKLLPSEIDLYLLHQGSRYIVDTLIKRLHLPADKVPIEISDCGNTVSSSIPLMLSRRLKVDDWRNILLCGFGVGLSAAACILTRE